MKGKLLQIDLIGVPGCGKTTVKLILQDLFTDTLLLSTNNRPVYSDDEGGWSLRKSVFVVFYSLEVLFLWLFFGFFFTGNRRGKIYSLLKEKYILSVIAKQDGFITEGVFHQMTRFRSLFLLRVFVSLNYIGKNAIVVYLRVADEQVARQQLGRVGLAAPREAAINRGRVGVRARREIIERFLNFLEKKWIGGNVVTVNVDGDDTPTMVACKVKARVEGILWARSKKSDE
jgi:hypothetical protein